MARTHFPRLGPGLSSSWLLWVACQPAAEAPPPEDTTVPAASPCSDVVDAHSIPLRTVADGVVGQLPSDTHARYEVVATIHGDEASLRDWLALQEPATESSRWAELDLSDVDWAEEVVVMAFTWAPQLEYTLELVDAAALAGPEDLCVAFAIRSPEGFGRDQLASPWTAVALPRDEYVIGRVDVEGP